MQGHDAESPGRRAATLIIGSDSSYPRRDRLYPAVLRAGARSRADGILRSSDHCRPAGPVGILSPSCGSSFLALVGLGGPGAHRPVAQQHTMACPVIGAHRDMERRSYGTLPTSRLEATAPQRISRRDGAGDGPHHADARVELVHRAVERQASGVSHGCEHTRTVAGSSSTPFIGRVVADAASRPAVPHNLLDDAAAAAPARNIPGVRRNRGDGTGWSGCRWCGRPDSRRSVAQSPPKRSRV